MAFKTSARRRILLGTGGAIAIVAIFMATVLVFSLFAPKKGDPASTPVDDLITVPTLDGWTTEPLDGVQAADDEYCLTFWASTADVDLALIFTTAVSTDRCSAYDDVFTATLVDTATGKEKWSTDLSGQGIADADRYLVGAVTDDYFYLRSSGFDEEPLVALHKGSGTVASSATVGEDFEIFRLPETKDDILVMTQGSGYSAVNYTRYNSGDLNEPVWEATVPSCTTPVVIENRIVIDDGQTLDLATGAASDPIAAANGCPMELDDVLIFDHVRTAEGFDHDGTSRWSIDKPEWSTLTATRWSLLTNVNRGMPDAARGPATTLFVSDSGILASIDPVTGEELAQFEVGKHFPHIYESKHAFIIESDAIAAYDKVGEHLWSVKTRAQIMGISENIVYLNIAGEGLSAVDILTGKKLWTLSSREFAMPLLFLGGHLVEFDPREGSLTQFVQ